MRDDATPGGGPDPKLAGVIRPNPEPGAGALFTIIRRDGWKRPPEDVRPCEHPGFLLDEKWGTVTCRECREKIDPFACLMLYARILERIESKRQDALHAAKRLTVRELRRLLALRDVTEEERAELRRAIQREHAHTLAELEAIEARVAKLVRARKEERRRVRAARGR